MPWQGCWSCPAGRGPAAALLRPVARSYPARSTGRLGETLHRQDAVRRAPAGVNVPSRSPSLRSPALSVRISPGRPGLSNNAWRTDDGRRGDHRPAAVGLPGGGAVESGAVLMSPALAAGLQIALVVAALALVHVPLGAYMARLFTSPKDK